MAEGAVYPGTFDPMTKGHVDIVQRACQIFDHVTVAIAKSTSKNPLFCYEERLDLAQNSLKDVQNVTIEGFDGLLVQYARDKNCDIIIRGLRAISDFEFEFQMALANRKLAEQVETIFLMPKEDYTFISSSIVKDIAKHGGDCNQFVPTCVAHALEKKFGKARVQ